jgi:hypothetical protein
LTGKPAEAVKFFDATGRGEIYPPADNPLVLTVGDADAASSAGPTADFRVKPDVILEDSRAFFSDGEVSVGSSNAAAYFAGIVAVLKAAEPGLRTRHLLRLARQRAAVTTASRDRFRNPRYFRRTPGIGRYPLAARPFRGPFPSLRPYVLKGPYGPIIFYPSPEEANPGRSFRAEMSSSGKTPPAVARPRSGTLSRSSVQSRLWRTPTRRRLAEVVRPDR